MQLYHASIAQITGGASDIGFEPGSVLITRAGVSTTLWSWLSPGFAVEAEFREPDELQGSDLGFTGSTIWSLTPSIWFYPARDLSLGVSVRVPVYFNVQGAQLVPGEFVGVSISAAL